MPPLGLSAGVRKAREFGLRRASLTLERPRILAPRAHYAPCAHDGILVLQRGENASTDYYLRPRLEKAGVPVAYADLDSPPSSCPLLAPGGAGALMVIVCRYATPAWLKALEAARDRLARVAFFMDDDLPAMMQDQSLPSGARGKVALHYGRQVERLGGLVSEVWVSSPVLAQRHPQTGARVLEPVPEADPPEPHVRPSRRVVYHGTDVHGPERSFVAEVARGLLAADPDITVEITGGPDLERHCRDLPNTVVVAQRPWRDYLDRQASAQADVSLAPLFPSPVNEARAPVKAFDAARLGAAGVYADMAPYKGFVRPGIDGMLVPMQPEAWVQAVSALCADPVRRLELAGAARERLLDLRRHPAPLPAPPGR